MNTEFAEKFFFGSHILENEDASNLSCPIPNKKWYILLKMHWI